MTALQSSRLQDIGFKITTTSMEIAVASVIKVDERKRQVSQQIISITILAPLIPSQRMWLALVVFPGEAVVHQHFLNLGIVCMTVDEAINSNTTNLTEWEAYYSDWKAG